MDSIILPIGPFNKKNSDLLGINHKVMNKNKNKVKFNHKS